ncbi:MAG: hypothetical protein IPL55_20750 [Saprospiraceae bacterium]|nr:hypothetical protein [Saprospiraceae bacterium]
MFIIVESGSTKADWVVVDDAENKRFYSSLGVNPSTQIDFEDLSEYKGLCLELPNISDVFFYGAGADDPESNSRIKGWLSSYGFNGNVKVAGDTIAAARACFGDTPGIVGILGTGSNSGVYDGKKITKAITSLGYVFSDEGSGVHLGREIIKSYFYGTMPHRISEIFKDNYHLTKSEVVQKVYREAGGSRYIASFAKFLTIINDDWKDKLIKKIFREFIELRILMYDESKTLPVRFAGSIAYYHKLYLDEVLAEYGLFTSEVVHQPIYKLIDYHINRK